jgi:hypothetical protein
MGLRELPPAWRCQMGVAFAENARPLCRSCCNPFHAALLFAIGLIGCNSTCYTFTSNPPTGTIGITVSDPTPTCKLTTVKGAVRIQMDTELACASCAGSGRVQHIFVSLQGIEVHASMTADEDSLDWQELLPPELVKQPLQVDLVKGTADRGGRGAPLGESVAIPAGIYRQARLRFVPNQPGTDGRLPEKNACGSVGFNCVVLADGRIQPLQLDGGSPELRITSDRIKGASLFVPPDTDTDLIIELKPVWLWFSSADEGVRLLPVLTGSAKVGRVDFDELGTPEDGVVHDSGRVVSYAEVIPERVSQR